MIKAPDAVMAAKKRSRTVSQSRISRLLYSRAGGLVRAWHKRGRRGAGKMVYQNLWNTAPPWGYWVETAICGVRERRILKAVPLHRHKSAPEPPSLLFCSDHVAISFSQARSGRRP